MNQREARRLVTQRVAAAARQVDDFDAYSPDDRRRLRVARDALAEELEVRCGMTERRPAQTTPDPAQITFDYEDQVGLA